MQALFKDWFTYNYNANKKFIQVLADDTIENKRPLEVFSHVLNAHQIWLHRIHTTEKVLSSAWQPLNKADLNQINNKLYRDTRTYLQSEKFGLHFQKPVNYLNFQGVKLCNTIEEIYFHILAHSAYHRGQIAMLLRNAEIDPPLSDYIFYKREQHVKL